MIYQTVQSLIAAIIFVLPKPKANPRRSLRRIDAVCEMGNSEWDDL